MSVVPFSPAGEYPRRVLRSTGQHVQWLYAVFTKRGLTCNEFGVMSVIIQHMNVVTGECWPTCGTIAEATGLSYRTVKRVLGGLDRKGLIRRERRPTQGEAQRLPLHDPPHPVHDLRRAPGLRRDGGLPFLRADRARKRGYLGVRLAHGLGARLAPLNPEKSVNPRGGLRR